MSAAAATKPRPISPQTRSQIARRARAELARRSLYEFLKLAWHVLEPGEEFEDNWHVKVFCDHVQWMLEGWLVANGHGTKAMEQRVRASWAAHGLEYVAGALLVQNLVLNLPPITLKSRILMVCAPAWAWLHAPAFKVCAISGQNDNVKRDSNAHRELVTSPWYVETFLRRADGTVAWRIKDGSRDKATGDRLAKVDAVDEWMTTAGGERKSRTLLGGFTGVHVDAIFLDDPDDAHKVHSDAKRKEVQWKWRRAIKNRVKHPDRSIRIAIQQRVHIDDWTAAQVAHRVWSPDDRKAWAWVAIPLQYGRAPKECPVVSPWGWRDPRVVANDNLQPTRFSPEFIADEIIDKGPEGFEGQYNQNPASLDDGLIKRAYVRFFTVEGDAPVTRARPHGCGITEDGTPEPAFVLKRDKETGALDLDWLTITIDASGGSTNEKHASAVGILVVGGKGQMRFVFDDRTAVMDPEAMNEAIDQAIAHWPVGRVLVELKALGASVISEMTKRIREGKIVDADGVPKIVVVEGVKVEPHDTKISRARAMLPSWQAGLVFVLDGAHWLYPKVVGDGRVLDQGFVGEMCSFPSSRRNDRVDAMSQVMAYYREQGDVVSRWRMLSRT